MVVEILENDHFRLAADSKCFFFCDKGTVICESCYAFNVRVQKLPSMQRSEKLLSK